MRTLGVVVKPLRIHSSTDAGASTAVQLAASAKASLMMLTVNSFVANMFSRVFFGRFCERLKEMLTSGGMCPTYIVRRRHRFLTSQTHTIEK